jgi:hypothetical protein
VPIIDATNGIEGEFDEISQDVDDENFAHGVSTDSAVYTVGCPDGKSTGVPASVDSPAASTVALSGEISFSGGSATLEQLNTDSAKGHFASAIAGVLNVDRSRVTVISVTQKASRRRSLLAAGAITVAFQVTGFADAASAEAASTTFEGAVTDGLLETKLQEADATVFADMGTVTATVVVDSPAASSPSPTSGQNQNDNVQTPSNPTDDAGKDGDEEEEGPPIIAIVGGALGALLLVGGVAFVYMQQQKKKKQQAAAVNGATKVAPQHIVDENATRAWET